MDKASKLVIKALDVMQQRASCSGPSGLKTQLPTLDSVTMGLQRSWLVILAGRPGMGKTALALNLAISCEATTLFISCEMSGVELVLRALSSMTGIYHSSIKSGRLTEAQWEELEAAAERLSNLGLWIEDRGGISMNDIEKLATTIDPDLVIIDYIQLLGSKTRDSREREVAEISRGCKALAKNANCVVIALSQLNRGVEHRDSKRPRLFDLRESGAIEQDADLVLMVHRQEYYEPENPEHAGRADLIIAKNRHGAAPTIGLLWKPEIQQFKEEI